MKIIIRFISLLFAITICILSMSGCRDHTRKAYMLHMDTATYVDSDATRSCHISIEYPADADSYLTRNFCEYVSESFGDSYTGCLFCPDSIVLYYGITLSDSLKSMSKKFGGKTWNGRIQLEENVDLKKIYETPHLITFERNSYNYCGGAHGSNSVSGVTFRKSDGRKFGRDMLVHTTDKGFRELITDGLKGYFSRNGEKVITDDQLNNQLLNVHVYNLPLPQNPPYLTKKGVTFVYEEYEIACYAAGIPTFTIPYNKIKPYLSRAVREALCLH